MVKKLIGKCNSGLLTKLVAATVFVLVVPFIISNIFTYIINYRAILKEYTSGNAGLLAAGVARWKEYIDTMENSSLVFYENAEERETLKSGETLAAGDEYALRERLSQLLKTENSFRKIQISFSNGQSLSQEKLGRENLGRWRSFIEPDWSGDYQKLAAGYDHDEKPAVLVFRKTLLDYPTDDFLFSMELYCDLDEMEKIADTINGIGTAAYDSDCGQGVVGLFDGNGKQLLYSTSSMDEIKYHEHGQGWIRGSLGGVDGFFFTAKSDYKDITFEAVKFIPQNILLKDLYRTIFWLFLVQAVLLALVLVFVMFVYHSMVRPVREIATNMKKVEEGVYEYTSQVKGNDEIAVLDHTYEEMVQRINMLINQEYKNALEISRARLKLLQAQINPHFLNNMLQNISTKALKEGSREIYDLLTKLARIFQYNMDTSADYVPFGHEIGHITNYLALQKERFRQNLSYEIECSEQALEIEVPKMILQPLVENSINHGIWGREDMGSIIVTAKTDDEGGKKVLHIEVVDNGAGMTIEKIEELKSRYDGSYTINSTQGHGIGFLNVLYRLDLYTDGAFEWEIQSVPMINTSVKFHIPIKERKVKDDENTNC